ncbi:MAG: Gfo/Idh/MocA family oxidoreductase [Planctomycetes bacterium]|nr:Gfo/Idh/MocA family oxidoreductase [Planctomycetota bacterium]
MAKPTSRHRPHVAVIGAGDISQGYHLPSLQHLAATGRCTFAAICDLDAKLAAAMARKFGAQRSYTDYVEMLRTEKPDGVVVITPIPVTARVAGSVMRMGFPVLLEKPPGGSSKECRQLIRAAEESGMPNCVSFNRRFCPVLVQGHDEMAKRGPVKGASARMFRLDRTDEEFFFGTGIHSLDTLRYLGGDIVSVETERRVVRAGERPTFSLILGYANGGVGTLTIRPQAGIQLERYEVFGEQSMAIIHAGVGWLIDKPGSCEVYSAGKPVRLPDPLKPYRAFTGKLYDAATGGFYGSEANFVESLRTGNALSPDLAESLQSVEIAEAVQAGRSWKARSR